MIAFMSERINIENKYAQSLHTLARNGNTHIKLIS